MHIVNREDVLHPLLLLLILIPAVIHSQNSAIVEAGRYGHYYDYCESVVIDDDNFAYLAMGTSGLLIVDVFRIDNPQITSSFESNLGYASALALADSFVYMADNIGGLYIIDVSDREHPVQVGVYDTPGQVVDVEVSGGFAYLADMAGGFRIIDVSDPENPVETGSYQLPYPVRAVSAAEEFICVAADSSGLWAFDVSDPGDPQPVGNLDATTATIDVITSDSLIYVLENQSGIRIINCDVDLQEVGFYQINTELSRIGIWRQYIYLSLYSNGFSVVDVSNSENPFSVGYFEGIAMDVAISADNVYVAGSSRGFSIHRNNNGQSYEVISTVAENTGIGVKDIRICESVAYLACGATNPQILNTEVPTDPQLIGLIDPNRGRYEHVFLQDNFLYIQNLNSGAQMYEISDPEEPEWIDQLFNGGFSSDVTASEDFAYLMAGGEVTVFEKDYPNPCIQRDSKFYGEMGSLSGSYLYVSDWDGMNIVDVSDPDNLELAGFISTPYPQRPEISGDYAYLPVPDEGLYIIDISDPQNPEFCTVFRVKDRAWEVDIQGDFAYLVTRWAGLYIIDISDPEHPGYVDYYDTPGDALSLEVRGDYVYVAEKTHLGIYDISEALRVDASNPNTPQTMTLLSSYPNPFNERVNLSFNLGRSGVVSLGIYDLNGREMTRLAEGRYLAGNHSLSWLARGLPAGVYCARLEADGVVDLLNLVVIK